MPRPRLHSPTNRTPRAGGWFLSLLAAGAVMLALVASVHASPSESEAEYRIKGAYLYNFTKFIDWPPQAFSKEDAPFVIAVLDRDPSSASVIAEVLKGKKTASGRPISVVAVSDYAAVPSDCQLLFISNSVPTDWTAIHTATDDRPVLVVGEKEGFAQQGGAINFIVAGDVVRIEINPRRAELAGLKLSGSLASVARLVRD